jgi:hypothetical protein
MKLVLGRAGRLAAGEDTLGELEEEPPPPLLTSPSPSSGICCSGGLYRNMYMCGI